MSNGQIASSYLPVSPPASSPPSSGIRVPCPAYWNTTTSPGALVVTSVVRWSRIAWRVAAPSRSRLGVKPKPPSVCAHRSASATQPISGAREYRLMPTHKARRCCPYPIRPGCAGPSGGTGVTMGGVGTNVEPDSGEPGNAISSGQSTWPSQDSKLLSPTRARGNSAITSVSDLPRTRRATLFIVGASSSKPPWVVEALALRPVASGETDQITLAIG